MSKKTKKVSIRCFVSENEIKFQLYLMKYANQLKNIEELTTEEITKKWNYDIQRKINRFLGDAKKPQWQDAMAQDVIKKNIEYLKSLPVPTDKQLIQDIFQDIKQEYIDHLKEKIQENSTGSLKQDKELLKYVNDLVLTSNPSKERFGIILLLMIKNLRTMPSFSGYSENWATDFFSNAVEKTLLYLNNFDERLLSKRTGDRSKAFAYVTQICFNAFVNIINIRKKESEFLKDTISYETHNFEGVQDLLIKVRNEEEYNIDLSSIYKININKKDTIQEINNKIKKGFEVIQNINTILIDNKALKDEIQYLSEITSNDEKTEDYNNYIKDLESKYTPINKKTKNTLFVKIPKGINVQDISYKAPNDIDIVISEKRIKEVFKKKEKIQVNSSNSFNGYDAETGLTKKQQEEVAKIQEEHYQEQMFNEEW